MWQWGKIVQAWEDSKKTDVTKVTLEQVKRVEKMINERPARKFNYQTPMMYFYKN
jgi:IS30 family transposase